jgi:hypothetical protein
MLFILTSLFLRKSICNATRVVQIIRFDKIETGSSVSVDPSCICKHSYFQADFILAFEVVEQKVRSRIRLKMCTVCPFFCPFPVISVQNIFVEFVN